MKCNHSWTAQKCSWETETASKTFGRHHALWLAVNETSFSFITILESSPLSKAIRILSTATNLNAVLSRCWMSLGSSGGSHTVSRFNQNPVLISKDHPLRMTMTFFFWGTLDYPLLARCVCERLVCKNLFHSEYIWNIPKKNTVSKFKG